MKKKLRKIVIEGKPVWWVADWFYENPDWTRILRVCIWGGDKMSRPLYANLTSKTIEYPIASAYPKPKDVSIVIVYALAHGWDPSARGGPHGLKEEGDQLELDDLRLIDIEPLHRAPR